MKLTRKQIKEGLDQVPIEAVLLGSAKRGEVKLTAKEKRFAEEMARGATKSDAYRIAYNPKGKRETINKRASEISKREGVQGYCEAIQAAIQAERFTTPAGLRALTIHELKKHALDESFPPAQRVKCLELLGKITEVALFTERREVIKVDDTQAARAKLLDSIKSAIKLDAIDAKLIEGDELLRELKTATASENAGDATPPTGHPPNTEIVGADTTHSNPHNESPAQASPEPSNTVDADVTDVTDTCPDSHHNICYGEKDEQNQ